MESLFILSHLSLLLTCINIDNIIEAKSLSIQGPTISSPSKSNFRRKFDRYFREAGELSSFEKIPMTIAEIGMESYPSERTIQMHFPEVLGPGMEFNDPTSSPSSRNTLAMTRIRREAEMTKPMDKSLSMPLADHSPGTSMAERPMSFIDWSQTPIQDDSPAIQRTVRPTRKRLVADGRSKAEAILLGNDDLWSWEYVVNSSSFSREGQQYYGFNCCTKLPYICGVDGVCILENATDCELFCQCASGQNFPHCTKTIPRIKSVMRKLENKLIFDVATEKRIVVSPKLEQRLERLKSVAMTTPPIPFPSSTFLFRILTTVQSHTLGLKPSMPSSVVFPSSTSPVNHNNTTVASTRISTLSSEAFTMKTPDVVTLGPKKRLTPSDASSSFSATIATLINNPSNPIDSTPEVDYDDVGYLDDFDTMGTIPPDHDSSTSDNFKLTADTTDDPASLDKNVTSVYNCWNCEENGGACVMGNDFQGHCVKDLADGCVHFRCIHGSCVSTDGFHSCECLAGWIGTFCDQPCPIQCGHNGFCANLADYVGTNTSLVNDVISLKAENGGNSVKEGGANVKEGVACVCHWNYTGEKCDKKRRIIPHIQKVVIPDDQISTWQVAVIVISTTVFLASFLILMTYFLWRRQWLPLRKLVFLFQDYEEDDGKQYDAFISYKGCPRDERFVLNHLYPKLEKELDFRLCLHFRDFPPGHPIANNIIYAIENSRRTIMILSPAYVMSEWCRLEYQKAQHEMLRLRHRLIPVVLEDIGDVPNVDRNLKTILETITYIKWPGEMESTFSKRSSHFWKLLELSMPKKKMDCSRSIAASDKTLTKSSVTDCSRSYFSHLVDSFSSHTMDDKGSFNLSNFFKGNQSTFYDNHLARHPVEINSSLALNETFTGSVPRGILVSPPYLNERHSTSVGTSDCFYDDVDVLQTDETTDYT